MLVVAAVVVAGRVSGVVVAGTGDGGVGGNEVEDDVATATLLLTTFGDCRAKS